MVNEQTQLYAQYINGTGKIVSKKIESHSFCEQARETIRHARVSARASRNLGSTKRESTSKLTTVLK